MCHRTSTLPFLRFFPDRFFLPFPPFLDLEVSLRFGLFRVELDLDFDWLTLDLFALVVLRDRSFFCDRAHLPFTPFLRDRASFIGVVVDLTV